jgi:hypothetical protein
MHMEQLATALGEPVLYFLWRPVRAPKRRRRGGRLPASFLRMKLPEDWAPLPRDSDEWEH